ncbi:hypothetical protein J2X31_000446 [Flavobacterium arsenatis]|uniref:Peptidase E n=1 Tax=Flavobacterium arsenatis TaxID=1484332 RepID=A0ABU1TKR2_9FLAO|nr:DUF6702 family protein [Flavobacterium arsenatis]MDR6966453.1 hypothetical protein [Flavobacterium arsenatis]
MKKKGFLLFLAVLFVSLSSFGLHKFYVSIYQINYVPEKKMLQITSRIFMDDLNFVLEKNFKKRVNIGEPIESEEDVSMMKKYINDNFSIKINGKQKQIHFLSKEIDNNVVVCYFNIKDISKINSIEIQNKVLLDLNSDQQNIIQTNIYGKKKSLMFEGEDYSGILKF